MNVRRSRVPQTIWPCLSPRWYRNNAFRLLMTWHDMIWRKVPNICTKWVSDLYYYFKKSRSSPCDRFSGHLWSNVAWRINGDVDYNNLYLLACIPTCLYSGLNGCKWNTASNGPVEWLPTDTMAYRTNRTEQLLCYSLCPPPPLWYNFQSAWSQGDN